MSSSRWEQKDHLLYKNCSNLSLYCIAQGLFSLVTIRTFEPIHFISIDSCDSYSYSCIFSHIIWQNTHNTSSDARGNPHKRIRTHKKSNIVLFLLIWIYTYLSISAWCCFSFGTIDYLLTYLPTYLLTLPLVYAIKQASNQARPIFILVPVPLNPW